MSIYVPSQFKRDLYLNLEGSSRRSPVPIDKAKLKAQDSAVFRLGESQNCSRLSSGIYDRGRERLAGDNDYFRKEANAGGLDDIYINAYGKADNICPLGLVVNVNACGKATACDTHGKSTRADGKAINAAACKPVIAVLPHDKAVIARGNDVNIVAYGKAQANSSGDCCKAKDAASEPVNAAIVRPRNKAVRANGDAYGEGNSINDDGKTARARGKAKAGDVGALGDNLPLVADYSCGYVDDKAQGPSACICMVVNSDGEESDGTLGIFDDLHVRDNDERSVVNPQRTDDEENQSKRALDIGNNGERGSSESLNANDLLSPRARDTNAVRVARVTAAKARDFLLEFENEVEIANDMLKRLKKPNSMIANGSMARVKRMLTDDMQQLLLGVLTREDLILELREDLAYMEGDNLKLQDKLGNALEQVKSRKATSRGLSADDYDRLDTLGFKSVTDLINAFIILQDRMETVGNKSGARNARSDISRTPSRASVVSEKRQVKEKPAVKAKPDRFSSTNELQAVPLRPRVQLPMPEKFFGKTRADLERFFNLYDASTESQGWNDAQRAVYLGQYIPRLQLYHDSLSERNASYQQMKKELLNTLGADTAATMYSLRSSLDRLKKPDGKPYKQFFEELELKVTEAFGSDPVLCEAELKKILHRVTEDDSDPSYCSYAIQNAGVSYYKLKEMIISYESAQSNRKKATKVDGAYGGRHYVRDEHSRGHRDENCRGNFRDENYKPSGDCVSFEKKERFVERKVESDGRAGGARTCRRCHKTGHYAVDCPDKEQHKANYVSLDELVYGVTGIFPVEDAAVKSTKEGPLFGKQCKMDVLFDGVKVNALLDSGACASVIRDTVVAKILAVNKHVRCGISEVEREAYSNKKLVGADGGQLKVVNCVTIPVGWGRHPVKLAKFFVVQGLSQDALIGTNVLQEGKYWLGALNYALQEKDDAEKTGNLNVIHLSSVSSLCNEFEKLEIVSTKSLNDEVKQQKPRMTHKRFDNRLRPRVCYGCRKPGHMIRDCWSLLRGMPAKQNGAVNGLVLPSFTVINKSKGEWRESKENGSGRHGAGSKYGGSKKSIAAAGPTRIRDYVAATPFHQKCNARRKGRDHTTHSKHDRCPNVYAARTWYNTAVYACTCRSQSKSSRGLVRDRGSNGQLSYSSARDLYSRSPARVTPRGSTPGTSWSKKNNEDQSCEPHLRAPNQYEFRGYDMNH